MSIYLCLSSASVCLQIAGLVSEGQVELYQRLSFERGGCCFLLVLRGLDFRRLKRSSVLRQKAPEGTEIKRRRVRTSEARVPGGFRAVQVAHCETS